MRILLFGLALFLSTASKAQLVTGTISTGIELNTWTPLELDAVNIITKGYEVGYVELGLKFSKFPKFSIPKLRYESNFETDEQSDIIALHEEQLSVSKYENFLGVFRYKKLIAKYSYETYISSVVARNNFNYVSREGVVVPVALGQNAGFTTEFETIFLGTDIRSFSAGLFYSTYKKPYFLTDNAFQDRSTMYHAEFTSYGIDAFRVFPSVWGKPIETELGLKLGVGDVDLGAAGSFSEILPSTDSVGFFELFMAAHWTKTISERSAFKFGVESRGRNFIKISSSSQNSSNENRGFNSDITAKAIMSYEYNF